MKKYALVFGLALFAHAASASLVQYSGTPKVVTASGVEAKVYPSATITGEKETVNVDVTGYGIRQKTVVLLKVNVYFASSYVDAGLKLDQENPLESFKAVRARIIRLTMLRSLTGEEIKNSFQDALVKNSVDITTPAFQSFFSQFGFDLKTGDEITLIATDTTSGEQKVTVELPGGKSLSSQGKDFANQLWTVWFGIPVDSGMKALREQLLGKVKP